MEAYQSMKSAALWLFISLSVLAVVFLSFADIQLQFDELPISTSLVFSFQDESSVNPFVPPNYWQCTEISMPTDPCGMSDLGMNCPPVPLNEELRKLKFLWRAMGNPCNLSRNEVPVVTRETRCWPIDQNHSKHACLPQVFIIGPPKTGTTELASLLIAHPNISLVKKGFKEPHIWGSYHTRYAFNKVGIETRLRNYYLKGPSAPLILDGSVYTYTSVPAALTLPRMFPDAKFMYLDRDPVDSYHSMMQYSHFGQLPNNCSLDNQEMTKLCRKGIRRTADCIEGVHRSKKKPKPNSKKKMSKKAGSPSITNNLTNPAVSIPHRNFHHIVPQQLAHCFFNFPGSWFTLSSHYFNLKPWFTSVTPDQLIIVNSTKLFKQPENITRQIWSLLGMPYDDHAFEKRSRNKSKCRWEADAATQESIREMQRYSEQFFDYLLDKFPYRLEDHVARQGLSQDRQGSVPS